MHPPSSALFSSIPQILSDRAADRPDATACTFLGRDLTVLSEPTYRELELAARKVASHLRGVARPGDRVLLLLPPGIEYVAAFLGCLYANIVAVPLYPPRLGTKIERITGVARDCDAVLALTTSAMMPLLDDLPLRSVVHTIETVLASGDAPDRGPDVDPDGIAFLQYTSGSTGRPKGVMVSHRNLVENERAISAGFGIRPDDVIVSWLPTYHDMGLIGTTLLPLFTGTKAVLLNTFEFIHDPFSWLAALARHGGTCSGGPNFAYQLLVDRYDPERLTGIDLSSWRIAFNGSEPVSRPTMDAFAERYAPHGFDPSAFSPCYGLAEATLYVTGSRPASGYHVSSFDRATAEQGSLVPGRGAGVDMVSSGSACVDTTVVIRDNEGRSVPPGVVGEICVRGPGVARGYWGDPAASLRTFRSEVSGYDGVFLRTGDLGALVDGQLYVAGRQKDLIIVAGRNFAPHDIEHAGSTADARLRTGAAAAFQADQDVVLVLEVQRKAVPTLKSDPAAADALAVAVRRNVSVECGLEVDHVQFVMPGSIPRTSSGKIRRSETATRYGSGDLRIVHTARSDPPAAVPIHADSRRDLLRQAAAGHLGAEPSPEDFEQPLAALGFDSLKLVALKNTLERELKRPLPAELFFGDHSLDDLTAAIDRRGRTDDVLPTDEAADTPASAGQIEMLFHDELNRGDTANNLACALRFSRPLDDRQVQEAVTGAVRRHPALRTTLGTLGKDTQVVNEDARLDWEAREFDEDDPARVRRFLAKVALRPYDLVGGPLVRAALVSTPTGAVFLLACHHAVADYWSLRIVLAEIVADLLDAKELVPPDEPGTASAVEWAKAQTRYPKDSLTALAEKWSPLRNEVLFPERQTGRRRNAAAIVDFEIEAAQMGPMLERGKALGFTPFVGVAAAYLHTLHTITGRDQVVIATPYHGRTGQRFARTVGHLVNMVPLLGDFRPGTDLASLAERTWRELRSALATAQVPFSHLIKELNPHRHGQPPLVQATLTFQQSADGVFPDAFAIPWTRRRHTVNGVDVEAFDVPPRDVAFPLSLYSAMDGDRLVCRLLYRRESLDAELADRISTHLAASLSELAAVSDVHAPTKS